MDIEAAANDFSKLIHVDLSTKLESVSKSTEDMLARLEEFQTMIAVARQERADITQSAAALVTFSGELDDLCKRIDKVGELVAHVKDNLNNLEKQVTKAEEEFGCAESSLKVANIFTPFFRKKTKLKNYFMDTLRKLTTDHANSKLNM